MYEKHFNFTENPFTIAPNPRYLYLTTQHREALAHLTYGLKEENGGFILLTGEVGTGKTTVCRTLLEQLPDNVRLAVILNPTLSEAELLETICDEFGVVYQQGSSVKNLIDALNAWLLQAHTNGERASVLIEEAQNLDIKLLEQLRLLTNLETNERKLLQIILVGQPELLENLERPELRQLSQRIVARYHLTALKRDDVRAYIMHRLQKAGGYPGIFPPAVILKITQLSRGIPRLINLICDRALLGCYAKDKHEVDMKTVVKAAGEVFGERHRASSLNTMSVVSKPWLSAAVLIILIGASFAYLNRNLWLDQMQKFWTQETVAVNLSADLSEPELVQTMPEKQPSAGSIADSTAMPSVANLSVEKKDLANAVAFVPLTWQTLHTKVPNEKEAYSALFSSWKLDTFGDEIQTPCQFAQDQGLDCWHQQGEFVDIERLNRPVVLKLLTEEGRPFYVALLETTSTRWKIGINQQTLEVTKQRIKGVWTGEYTMVWKRPLGYIRTIRPNDSGRLVVWLGEQLAKIQGRRVSQRGKQSVYDISLIAAVRRFQRSCGLQVDGLLGRETIMMLNTINHHAPVLSISRRNACSRKLNV